MLAPAGAYDSRFTRARDELASYPTLRWRAGLHHLRRMLADARGEEAAALADHLVAEASLAGMPGAAEHVREVQRRTIGRASCRERVCQYVWISVVAGSLKIKNRNKKHNK